MAEHIHGCLTCRPDMVPDFARDDERYHDGQKCGVNVFTKVNGVDVTYTTGIFEGPEGWVLFAGRDVDGLHTCPVHRDDICIEPRFGHVEVVHECPAAVLKRRRRDVERWG